MKPAVDSKYEIAKPNYCCTMCEVEVACESPYYSAIFFHAGEFARRDFCEGCWEQHVSAGTSGPQAQPDHAAGDASSAGSEGGSDEDPSSVGATEDAGVDDVVIDEGRDQVVAAVPPYAFWRTRRPQLPTDQPKRVRFDVELALQFFRSVAGDTVNDEAAADPAAEDTPATGASGGDVLVDDVVATSDVASDLDTSDLSALSAEEEPTGLEERDQLGFVVALLLIRKKVLTLDSTAARDGQEYLKVTERKEPRTSSWIRNPELTPSELERVKVRLSDLLHMQI